jgi:hypothetical protein
MTSKTREFAEPHLHGDRFDPLPGEEPSLPIDALVELVTYRNLVVEVAKELHRERTGNERLPPNFEDGFKLRLTKIGQGSSVAVLKREYRDLGTYAPPPGPDIFDAAKTYVDEGVYSFETQGHLPEIFRSPKVVPLFKRFGRTLNPGESIELRRANGVPRVIYSAETRRQMVIAAVGSMVEQVTLRGTVAAVQQDPKRVVTLRTEEHGLVKVTYPQHMSQDLATAFRDHRFTRVEVRGLATFDKKGQIKKFEDPSVTLVSDLRGEDVSHLENRLEMFAKLEAEPLDDGDESPLSVPPSKEGLAWLRHLLLSAMASGRLPLPYLYPTPEGGVLAAWSHSPWEASVEFNLQTKTADLHAADVATGETYTAVVVFATDEDAGIKEFTRFLRKFIPVEERRS